MSKKPVVLMILDGYGLNDKKEHNAVAEAKTHFATKISSKGTHLDKQVFNAS